MTITSYTSPGTTANADRSSSVSWSNTDNVKVSDDNRATSSILKNDFSDWLRVNNFGFSIPDGATIDGIEVQIEHRRNSGQNPVDSAVFLRKTSGQVGSNFSDATEWTTSTDETFTYGDATELWGTTWSVSEINSSDFGLDFSVFADLDDSTPEIDHIQIRIHYTEAASNPTTQGITTIQGVQSITL